MPQQSAFRLSDVFGIRAERANLPLKNRLPSCRAWNNCSLLGELSVSIPQTGFRWHPIILLLNRWQAHLFAWVPPYFGKTRLEASLFLPCHDS